MKHAGGLKKLIVRLVVALLAAGIFGFGSMVFLSDTGTMFAMQSRTAPGWTAVPPYLL